MTVKLGSQGSMVTLPEVQADSGCTSDWAIIQSFDRGPDGTAMVDRWALKRRWGLRWRRLAPADVSTIETEACKDEMLDFQPLEGGTYDVYVISFHKEPYTLAVGTRWDVSLVLEEA